MQDFDFQQTIQALKSISFCTFIHKQSKTLRLNLLKKDDLQNIQKINIVLPSKHNNPNYLELKPVYDILKQLENLDQVQISISQQRALNFDISQFIQSLNTVQSLKKFKFALGIYNNNSEDKFTDLHNFICKQEDLRQLFIKISRGNKVNSQFFSNMSKYFENMTQLKYLTLILDRILKDENTIQVGINLNKSIMIQELNIDLRFTNKELISIKDLAQSISNLTKLRKISLYLKDCQVADEELQLLCQSLKCLKQISQLYIYISQPSVLLLLCLIQFLPLLRNSSFQINYIKSNYFYRENEFNTPIASQDVGRNIQIQSLEININLLILDIEGAQAIRNAIKEFSSLIDFKLYLNDINIGPKQMEIISEGIQQLKKLRFFVLDISANSAIGELGCSGIGNALSHLILLEDLKIVFEQWNKIKTNGITHIGNGIKHLKNLKKLNIVFGDYNEITMEGAENFFQGVCNLNELQEFIFHFGKGNQIGEIGFQQIGLQLQNLQKLQKLEFQFGESNKINPNGLTLMQNEFKFLSQNLLDLNLNINFNPNFEGQSIVELANCLKYLENLNILQLELRAQENIEQRVGLKLYKSISQLKKLKKISIKLDKLFILQFVSLPQELIQLEENKFNLFGLKSISFKRESNSLQNCIQSQQKNSQENDCCTKSDISSQTKNLTELNVCVDKQNIQSEGILSLSFALKRLTFLKRLEVKILPNAIHAEGARNLAYSFQYLGNLEILSIKICKLNKIGEMGAQYIEQNLKYLVNLKSFSISVGRSNFLGKDGLKFLVQGIKTMPNVKFIEFGMSYINNIKWQDQQILIEEFSNWKNVIQLTLKIKFLDYASYLEFINSMFISLSQLKQLIKLSCEFSHSKIKPYKYTLMKKLVRPVFIS